MKTILFLALAMPVSLVDAFVNEYFREVRRRREISDLLLAEKIRHELYALKKVLIG